MQGIQILIPLLFVGVMMFFLNRTQKKQQQKRNDVLSAMKVGDKIVTIGGLHGVIAEINEADKIVTIDCDGVYLDFNRAAISNIQPGNPTTPVETVTEPEVAAEGETEVEKNQPEA